MSTEVFAHRGWSAKYPENTLVAFIAALELGVDGIELDVHLTKDRKLVVIHDPVLGRTARGQGWVEDLTYDEIKTLDAGSWFGDDHAGAQIPTLEDVLRLLAATPKAKVNIEIKNGRAPYVGLPAQMWELVQAYRMEGRTIVSSFNHYALQELKQLYPVSSIAPLYMAAFVDPWRYANSLGAEGLHPYLESFNETIVRSAHASGVAIRAYTVNDKEVMKRFMKWNVDAIITDHPDVMLAVRNDAEKE